VTRPDVVRTLISSGAACTIVVVAAFAVVRTLPVPGADAQTGARLVAVLQRLHGSGSVIRIDGKRVLAHCHRVYRDVQLVVYSDGTSIILRAATVVRPRSDTRPAASGAAERRAALADLGGDYELYMHALLIRLRQGSRIVDGRAVVRGQAALRIRIGRDQPRLELLVARRTLRPLAAFYSSLRLRGEAVLLAPTRRTSGC